MPWLRGGWDADTSACWTILIGRIYATVEMLVRFRLRSTVQKISFPTEACCVKRNTNPHYAMLAHPYGLSIKCQPRLPCPHIMTYFQLCVNFFVAMMAFSTISLAAGSSDGYIVQVEEFVAEAEFFHMNVTQHFGGKLFARQVCPAGDFVCACAPNDPSIKLNLF